MCGLNWNIHISWENDYYYYNQMQLLDSLHVFQILHGHIAYIQATQYSLRPIEVVEFVNFEVERMLT